MLKNIVYTVAQIGILYLFYLIGSYIQDVFRLFIPGSIIGMLLFFIVLMVWKPFERFVEKGTSFILAHLPIFFTPATVGVIVYFDLFKGKGVWLVVITIVSTIIVLISSAYTTRIVQKVKERVKG
ncbi:CidA/LrgA family protein [Pueribacillus sp. YX66]|uniref:CidA/LrgA family protein n=1 Tax=Pueribacillus sp. YX66 TaxID=3229242 RepID=UPI00358D7A37